MISTDLLVVFTISLLTSFMLVKFLRTRRNRTNLPPGFTPWPLLGNLPNLIGTEPHLFITKVGKHFDGVSTFFFGSTPAVVIHRLDQATEAFVKQNGLSDRQIPPLLERSFSSRGSVLWENGSVWRLHRRSIHSGLRHIESTNDNLSSKIISEAEKLFEKLDQKLHTPIDLSESLTALSARVVCSVAFGRRFDSFAESKSFADFLLGVRLVAKQFSVFSLAIIFPRLYDTFLYREVRTSVQYIKTFLSDMLREHKEAFQDHAICDVMDAYCDVMRKQADSDISAKIDERDIWRTFFDLLGAGTETTANSLLWGVMYMCGHPDYQERIAEELVNLSSNSSEAITDARRDELPLTQAAILEVMRCATVVPLGVPRVTARDTRICGYDLPKGTEVWLNEYAIHNDVILWEEPNLFRPERFLNASRDSILTEKRNQLVSFGLGKRICVGKKLAEAELFIVFSNLLRRYHVRFAEPTQKIDKVGNFGLTYSPKPFMVVLEKRD